MVTSGSSQDTGTGTRFTLLPETTKKRQNIRNKGFQDIVSDIRQQTVVILEEWETIEMGLASTPQRDCRVSRPLHREGGPEPSRLPDLRGWGKNRTKAAGVCRWTQKRVLHKESSSELCRCVHLLRVLAWVPILGLGP